jgi:peptide-methionine (S)-S-oxide reductase
MAKKRRRLMAETQLATFAAGCFWGVEESFRTMAGVLSTRVGYIGGKTTNPTYEQVCTGSTGHAEALEITFDPGQISYEQLLNQFWRIHNPTTLNRQGPDIGSQYRSGIFIHSVEQRQQAEVSKQALVVSGRWPNPVVTEVTEASVFYPAEDYHQQYFFKRGIDGAACHVPLY